MTVQIESEYIREFNIAWEAAFEAGQVVRSFYDTHSATTYTKGDGSPVTDADLASDRIIRERLGSAFPDDAILTEEGRDDPARLENRRCWIVDPIDGTQQFINRTGEFDVLIALVVDGRPVVSVLYQPSENRGLMAMSGGGAFVYEDGETDPVTFARTDSAPRIFTSHYFGAPASLPFLERVSERTQSELPVVSPFGVTPRYLLPTVSRYDAMIGLNPAFHIGMAWEWDFVASDLFVHEAGGRFTDLWGRLHQYNKVSARNFGGFVMSVDTTVHQTLLDAIAPELPESISRG